jgi:hypothetical protein
MAFTPPHRRGQTARERDTRCNRAAALSGVSSAWLRATPDAFKDALTTASGRAVIRTELGVQPLREFLREWMSDEEFAAIDTKGDATAALRQRVRESVPDVGRPVDEAPDDAGEVYPTRAAAQRVVEAMRDGRRTALPDPPPRPDAPPSLPGV